MDDEVAEGDEFAGLGADEDELLVDQFGGRVLLAHRHADHVVQVDAAPALPPNPPRQTPTSPCAGPGTMEQVLCCRTRSGTDLDRLSTTKLG